MNEQHSNHPTGKEVTPRIYVASLADYNAGRLLGRWIDADQAAECIREQIAEMLAESRQLVAEEWAIHDYEGFGSLRLGEFEDLERVADAACVIAEHGPLFAALVNHFGGLEYNEQARQYLEDGYCGAFDSLADYAEQLIEDCYGSLLNDLPDFIRYHIDYERIGDDMELSGDIFTVELGGVVHVFHSCI